MNLFRANNFTRVLAANSTAAAWATLSPTQVEPTGAGVIDVTQPENQLTSMYANLIPYGRDAALDTFSMRVFGWAPIGSTPQSRVWLPVFLFEVLCTLSTQTGPAGSEALIGSSDFFTDDITLTEGNLGKQDGEITAYGTGNNVMAIITADMRGFRKLQFDFKIATGATEMNCLYSAVGRI